MHPILILSYHSVADLENEEYDHWCVSPRRFSQHMSVLKRPNYTVLKTGDLIGRLKADTPLPDRCAVLTFDDGLHDFLTGAAPILEQFGFPATLYVVAGLIGRTSVWLASVGETNRVMLTACELRELAGAGIEIGGHSMTHPELDILDNEAAWNEIRNSRLVLEDIIGAPVRSFAYPHGYASSTTRRLTREAGYASAVRVRHAMSATDEDLFGLSRMVVTDDLDAARFTAFIEGREVPVAPAQDRFIGTLWRAARRVRSSRARSRTPIRALAAGDL